MKKFKRIRNNQKMKQRFKRCPLGGMCFNPLCAFGCIEN